MLYLLAGAPRCGKTLVSRHFTEELGIPRLSTDLLVWMLQESAPEHGVIFEKPFIKKAEKFWKFLKPALEYFIKEETSYIVEGDAILPKHLREIHDEHPGNLRIAATGFTKALAKDKLESVRNYASSSSEYDWTNEINDTQMLKTIQEMIDFSKYIEKECKKYNVPYIDMSHNFDNQLEKVITILKKGL